MGAGATLHSPGDDLGLGMGGFGGDRRQFFCHSCNRNMSYNGAEDNSTLLCPYCGSSFLEEMTREQHLEGSDLRQLQQRRRDLQNLSSEQSRRLTNAALMLRLLEYQLQGEISSLNDAVRRRREQQSEDSKCMSPVMRKKLRRSVMDTDTVCGQPSCPICSEDFEVDSEQLCMPCGHFYHEGCVEPWLDAKKTCPICRFELTNEVPSVQDLEKFSVEQLKEKYRIELEEEEQALAASEKKRKEAEKEKEKEKKKEKEQCEDGDSSGGEQPLFPPPEGYEARLREEQLSQRTEKFASVGVNDKRALCEEIKEMMAQRKSELDAEKEEISLPSASGLTQSLMREILTGGGREESSSSPFAAPSLQELLRGGEDVPTPTLGDLLGTRGDSQGARDVQRIHRPHLTGSASASSSRSLREIMDEGEEDYVPDAREAMVRRIREEEAARQRIMQRVVEHNASFDEDDEASIRRTGRDPRIPITSRQLAEQSGIVSALTEMQRQQRQGDQGVRVRGDDDDDEHDNDHDDDGGNEAAVRRQMELAGISMPNRPMMVNINGLPSGLLPAGMLRGPHGGMPTGRVIQVPQGMGLMVPQTFVVRSEGQGLTGPTQAERRAALREAMGLVSPPPS
eukprot:GSChrysophyteH1.ASY1.ANO1.1514.1 assembled CDS